MRDYSKHIEWERKFHFKIYSFLNKKNHCNLNELKPTNGSYVQWLLFVFFFIGNYHAALFSGVSDYSVLIYLASLLFGFQFGWSFWQLYRITGFHLPDFHLPLLIICSLWFGFWHKTRWRQTICPIFFSANKIDHMHFNYKINLA